MSADNWTTCPKCKIEKDKEREVLEEKYATGYGVIPVKEFERISQALAKKISYPSTLAEYYEIGIDGAVFSVSYTALCSVCGWEYRFDGEEILNLAS